MIIRRILNSNVRYEYWSTQKGWVPNRLDATPISPTVLNSLLAVLRTQRTPETLYTGAISI